MYLKLLANTTLICSYCLCCQAVKLILKIKSNPCFYVFQCVQFHPNGNYVATGSSDRSVRIFDVLNGTCVRTLTGHKVWTLS